MHFAINGTLNSSIFLQVIDRIGMPDLLNICNADYDERYIFWILNNISSLRDFVMVG
jgi:hypothetical protein